MYKIAYNAQCLHIKRAMYFSFCKLDIADFFVPPSRLYNNDMVANLDPVIIKMIQKYTIFLRFKICCD